MAQTGFTPISIYYSATATNVPSASNLVAGELAINTADGKLFYKDSAGVVQTLASKDVNSGTFTNISVSGVATFGAGTVSLPSITTTGDTNTGIFFPAADTIAFTEGGAESMRIDSSGNVGIGTSSPSYKLQVVNSGGLSLIAATSSDASGVTTYMQANGALAGIFGTLSNHPQTFVTNNTERMRIDSSGNLLVGTTGTGAQNSYSFSYNVPSGFGAFNHVNNTGSGATYVQFNYNVSTIGNITQNGTTGVLYNLTSDYRLKNNPVPLTGASEFIMALQPKTWDWYDGSGKGVGFIAHEFMEVAKYSGNGKKDEVDSKGKPIYQSIQPSSSEVMANLVALVQELKAEIDLLKGAK